MDYAEYKKQTMLGFWYLSKIYQYQDADKNQYRIITYKRAILYLNALDTEKQFHDFYTLLKNNKISGLSPKFAPKFKQMQHSFEKLRVQYMKLAEPFQQNDAFMQSIADRLKKKIDTKFEILGSIERKDINIQDIDILVLNEDKNALISEFQKKMKIQKITNIRDSEFTITRLLVSVKQQQISKLVRIEIYACEQQSYVTAKLYLTGSKYFTICLRGIFNKLGLTLTQKYIKGHQTFYPKTEEEVFVMLNLKYLEPHLR